jgi:hypothetical protein
MSTDVSEERIASIFTVEEYAEQETRVKAGGKQSWRRYIPPKHRPTFNGLHGFMSQKIILFISTAVRTSNRTKQKFIENSKLLISYN